MPASSAVPSDESMAVCPQCCHANPPTHHFCESCNAPLSAAAAILPSWRPWAEGALVRRAVRQADSWLVLIGIWAIFLPPLLFPLLISSVEPPWTAFVEEWRYGSQFAALIGAIFQLLLIGGGFALYGAILYQTTRSFLRNRRQEITTASSE